MIVNKHDHIRWSMLPRQAQHSVEKDPFRCRESGNEQQAERGGATLSLTGLSDKRQPEAWNGWASGRLAPD